MSSKLVTFLALASAVFAAACSDVRNKLGPSEVQLQRDRLVRMIDDRRYNDVIELVEPEIAAGRAQDLKPELALAYLGVAGFEPLAYARKVSEVQTDIPADLDQAFAGCPRHAVSEGAQLPGRCWSQRIARHWPDAESAALKRARVLLAEAFPRAEDAPEKYNVLISVLDVGCAIKRMARVLVEYNAIDVDALATQPLVVDSESQAEKVLRGLADAATDARDGLAHARRSPRVFAKTLTGLESAPMLDQGGVQYLEETGLPKLIKTATDSSESAEAYIGKAWVLQQVDELSRKMKGQ